MWETVECGQERKEEQASHFVSGRSAEITQYNVLVHFAEMRGWKIRSLCQKVLLFYLHVLLRGPIQLYTKTNVHYFPPSLRNVRSLSPPHLPPPPPREQTGAWSVREGIFAAVVCLGFWCLMLREGDRMSLGGTGGGGKWRRRRPQTPSLCRKPHFDSGAQNSPIYVLQFLSPPENNSTSMYFPGKKKKCSP